VARDIGWKRYGALPRSASHQHDNFDTRRAFVALKELTAAGFAEERMSGAGSRWALLR
jgi:hypothetical protein